MTLLFKDQQDVDDWLDDIKTLTEFWEETAVYNLPLYEDEEICNAEIAAGRVDAETALIVLKGDARTALYDLFKLEPRGLDPAIYKTYTTYH